MRAPRDAGPSTQHRTRIGWRLGFVPFPADPVIVLRVAQGLLEAPISASSTGRKPLGGDPGSVDLLQPGRRSSAGTRNTTVYITDRVSRAPDITLVEGRAKGECFVGYSAATTNEAISKDAHRSTDPWRTWQDGPGASRALPSIVSVK